MPLRPTGVVPAEFEAAEKPLSADGAFELLIRDRYLLLIVQGKLTAAQRVPLENGPECKPEET